MATNNLPLPLQLTEPVLLVGDLGELRGEYDPKTQLCSHTSSRQNTQSFGLERTVTGGGMPTWRVSDGQRIARCATRLRSPSHTTQDDGALTARERELPVPAPTPN
jgi:hypothetical protein